MNIKLIIIVSFSILYALFEMLLSRWQKSKRTVLVTGDKGSFRWLVISISFGYWLSYIAASMKFSRIPHWNIFFITGMCLAVTGLIIRISSVLTLSRQFTYTVTRIEDHELIDRGLYKFLRHPGYLGQLIIFLGVSVSLSNWLSITAMMIPVLAGYINRIFVEEKFMEKVMGQKYLDYKVRTWRLIPWVW